MEKEKTIKSTCEFHWLVYLNRFDHKKDFYLKYNKKIVLKYITCIILYIENKTVIC